MSRRAELTLNRDLPVSSPFSQAIEPNFNRSSSRVNPFLFYQKDIIEGEDG